MAFIEVSGLGDDYEDKHVEEGRYGLRISSAKNQMAKDGKSPQVMVVIAIETDEDGNSVGEGVASLFHYLTFPNKDDDKDQVRTKMRMNARFFKAFGVPFEKNGFNDEDLPGLEATVLLGLDEYEGEVRNKMILPKAADE